MNIGWLIDADMFEGYRDELVAAIRDQGHDAKLVHTPSPPFRWDDEGCCKTTDNSYHVLEVGGFSFADLYACNKADVVAAVSAAAKGVWREARG